jgi:hypothetical protein
MSILRILYTAKVGKESVFVKILHGYWPEPKIYFHMIGAGMFRLLFSEQIPFY